jgi:pimeloyl-ACP methyl ester carboxylesterase
MINIAGVELECYDAGQGRATLFLHGEEGFSPEHPFVPLLAANRRLIAPSHPGFGRSSLPDWIDQADDIAYVHLELMDRLALREADLVGCGIGGWIAGEMATKAPDRFRRIALIGPVGVKVGRPDKLDVPDIFAMPEAQVAKLRYHDPEKFRFDPAALSDEQLAVRLRNRESLALLTWEPYMHNPKLRRRLHRVSGPVLLARGAGDGMVSADYLAGYARLFPHPRSAAIASAGHLAHLEQPQAFAELVLSFLDA